MSMMKVVFRMLDAAGLNFIEPRREDGHGSTLDNPSHVSVGSTVQTKDTSDIEYLVFAGSVIAAGDTPLVTPSPGKRIRLHWVYAINDPVSSTSTKIKIRLGAIVKYESWAISKRQQHTGPVDGALIVNLSNSGDVAVTIFYEEI